MFSLLICCAIITILLVSCVPDTENEAEIPSDSSLSVPVCNVYSGYVNRCEEVDGKIRFSLGQRDSDGEVQYSYFECADCPYISGLNIDYDIRCMDEITVYSFTTDEDSDSEYIPAHMVIRTPSTDVFYAVIFDKSENSIMLEGIELNDINRRSFYSISVNEGFCLYKSIGQPGSLDDFEIGDLVALRGTLSPLEPLPAFFNRIEEIRLLVKGYDPDAYFDWNEYV